jgi:hypothetical protein
LHKPNPSSANDQSAVLVVVSDHEFMNILHLVNLYIPFPQAELIQATANPQSTVPVIGLWKAQPWLAGGMAAIMLHDSNDKETTEQVRALLDMPTADSDNGIAEILDRDAIKSEAPFRMRLPCRSESRLLHRSRNHRQPGH